MCELGIVQTAIRLHARQQVIRFILKSITDPKLHVHSSLGP